MTDVQKARQEPADRGSAAANLESFGEAVINGKRIERRENDKIKSGPTLDRVVHFRRSVSPDRQPGRLR
jgi:hypothetical protein